jgi:FKBP-type peptidyl-prolyl cis-trans isomerase
VRLVVPALALVAALVLAGCGSDAKTSSSTVASASTATTATAPTTPTTPTTATSTTTGPTPAQVGKRFKRPTTPAHGGPVPDQLVSKDVVKGTGEVLEAGDTAIVNYSGSDWRTGKLFDSSWRTGQPATLRVDQGAVIPGWWLGLPGMKVGGRRTLAIPSALGYGKAGQPPTIKPNEPLFFVVDLLGVQKATPAGVTQGQPAPTG